MYADELTESMEKAITETNRRRSIQEKYNKDNNIVPKTIKKEIRELIKATYAQAADSETKYELEENETVEEAVARLTDEMIKYAKNLEFEKAAEIRDQIQMLTGGVE
jgi:excinuclease ABC subunit B